MTKTIKINRCFFCPFRHGQYYREDCSYYQKTILKEFEQEPDGFTKPDWCGVWQIRVYDRNNAT